MLSGLPFAKAIDVPLGPAIVTLTVGLFLAVLTGRLLIDRLRNAN
jgi:ABC-type Mn2+/Zn2+ transport system permease subunit